jgi:hypothetical protein
MLTKPSDASRKLGVSTPSSVTVTSAKDWMIFRLGGLTIGHPDLDRFKIRHDMLCRGEVGSNVDKDNAEFSGSVEGEVQGSNCARIDTALIVEEKATLGTRWKHASNARAGRGANVSEETHV